MKPAIAAIICSIVSMSCSSTRHEWKTAKEGFSFAMPGDWKEKKVQGIDSHIGEYRGKDAFLEFDHVDEFLYPKESAETAISKLRRKKANSAFLDKDEEIWVLDGKLASFRLRRVAPKIYGKRKYKNVATLFVPFDRDPGYLSVLIFYKDEDSLPTVLRILKSFKWNDTAE